MPTTIANQQFALHPGLPRQAALATEEVMEVVMSEARERAMEAAMSQATEQAKEEEKEQEKEQAKGHLLVFRFSVQAVCAASALLKGWAVVHAAAHAAGSLPGPDSEKLLPALHSSASLHSEPTSAATKIARCPQSPTAQEKPAIASNR